LTYRRCRYDDLGGISGILQEVRELIEYPLVHPEVYAHLGIEPVRMMRHLPVLLFRISGSNHAERERKNTEYIRLSAG